MKYLNEIIDTLSQNKIMYLIDEELSNHTSIKIGGKCKIFVITYFLIYVLSFGQIIVKICLYIFAFNNRLPFFISRLLKRKRNWYMLWIIYKK